MEKNDKELIRESYDYLKDLCDFLSDEYEYEFEDPATEKEILDWESENKIKLPSMLKDKEISVSFVLRVNFAVLSAILFSLN